ncbi:hypothetical protein DMENIID0001_031000 [Sergentomyia squamirostris]
MSCNIILDKSDGVYLAGETLSGRVEITNCRAINIHYLTLIIKGSANVRWTESETYKEDGKKKTKSVTYSAHEHYLNSRTILFGQENGPSIQLPAGSHSYTFTCVLPHSLPGSMFGIYGKIEYKAQVKFDVPWTYDDNFNRVFKVLPNVDLNQEPSLRMASVTERVQKFCSWSCTMSPAVITITLPQTGFLRKDIIPIGIRISNSSSVEVTGVQVKLIKSVSFKSTTPKVKERKERTKIVFQTFNLVGRTNNRNIDINARLAIPLTPPTCEQSSSIKTIYYVEVAVYVSGCHKTTRTTTPITIGTFPIVPDGNRNMDMSQLLGFQAMQQSAIVNQAIFSGSIASIATAPSASVIDEEAPPPSYSEVVYGWKNNEKAYQSSTASSS